MLTLILMAGVPAALAQSQAEPSANASTKAESFDPKRVKLIADTHRMLALSREVQAEMAKNGPDTLSLAMVKKVEELQKLAAVVKAEVGKVP
ncbi:hypothetical protein HDF16_003882 [Granulicella aggregans]|uniref:Uncharacterized protein n=1 Tax=Granulicella aggregans TaxID=474949 RepID=A0A7W7ZGE3_9BACT|nr:hypothetical protein [Granulicella aggregans]MBB5059159.1 hypothetical protein [Granulicella aggregans]